MRQRTRWLFGIVFVGLALALGGCASLWDDDDDCCDHHNKPDAKHVAPDLRTRSWNR